MTKPQVKIVNSETGEEIVRDMNADELAQYELDKAAAKADSDALAAKAAEKSALLTKLGITADEAKLLLS
jgi:hypothetical protein